MLDGSPWPEVSIVTPSYNQAQFLEVAIRSVLLQGYPQMQYLIIDGGSTDGSVEVIRKYAPWIDGWASERDRGQAHAINKGLAKAGGSILSWLNADDFLLPNAVAHIAQMQHQNPDAVAWVGGCYRVAPDGEIMNVVLPRGLDRDSLADWFHRGFFYQPSCYFAAWAWRRAGALDERLRFALDLDLWLKLAAMGEFAPTARMLSAAVIHADAKTQSLRAEMHAETAVVQIRHGYEEVAKDRLVRLLGKPLSDRVRGRIKARIGEIAHRLRFWRKKRFWFTERGS